MRCPAEFVSWVLDGIDQLEELFTQTSSAAAREEFVQELWSLASAPEPGLLVILTLQVDFIGRCGELTVNPEGLRLDRIAYDEAHRCFVVQPDPEQLRAAIVEPARKVGLELESGLWERILLELGKEPGAMPLLQDVLDALWRRREGSLLTQAAYDALGGIVGALQNRADALLDALALRGDLRVAQRLLLSLVAVSGDTALDTRLRMPGAELRAQAGELAAPSERVLAELVAAGLLVQDEDGQGATVEIAHETLIRKWPRLRTWLAEDRAALVVQRRVRQAAKDWEQGRDESLLYRGTQLAWATEWRKTWSARIGELERKFLDASEALRVRTEQEAAERLSLERQAAERIRQLLLDSYVERGYKLLDSASGAEESLLWLFRAYRQGSSNLVLPTLLRRALRPVDARRTVISRGENIRAAVLSPDDRRLITITDSGSVLISDADSGESLFSPGPARSAMFSPEGKQLLLCGDSGVQIFESESGQLLLDIPGAFRSATLSPDGRSLFLLDGANTFLCFDASSGRELLAVPFDADTETLLAHDAEGQRLLVASGPDAVLEIRDMRGRDSGQSPAPFAEPLSGVTSAVLSSNGQRIFALTNQGAGIVLDASSGQQLARFEDVGSLELTPMIFCPTASRVVLPSRTGSTARICSATSGAVLESLRGHSCDVRAVIFSPSGRRIVSCGWDETARIYDADLGAPIRERAIAQSSQTGPDPGEGRLSRDGRHRLLQGAYFSVDVLDATSDQTVGTLSGHEGLITSSRFSPDGRRIVTTSEDGTARLYETERFGTLAVLGGHGVAVNQAAFDAASQRIVTLAADGVARVFDVETGFLLSIHSVPGVQITDANFSEADRCLIALCSDATERAFDITPEARGAEELKDLIARRALLRFESDTSRAPVANLWK